jgi:hypothetical protein
MSKVDYKDDYNYASTRINNTIVMHDGMPFKVDGIGAGKVFCGVKVLEGIFEEHKLEELDLSPRRVGYVNKGGVAHYCMRMPSRHYKQGLCQENFFSPMHKVSPWDKETSKSLAGQYPKPFNAAECVYNEEVSSAAFSQDFSFSMLADKLSLFFRNMAVGHAVLSSGGKLNFKLDEDKFYLTEVLERSYNV